MTDEGFPPPWPRTFMERKIANLKGVILENLLPKLEAVELMRQQ